jgi:hypothetical protein
MNYFARPHVRFGFRCEQKFVDSDREGFGGASDFVEIHQKLRQVSRLTFESHDGAVDDARHVQSASHQFGVQRFVRSQRGADGLADAGDGVRFIRNGKNGGFARQHWWPKNQLERRPFQHRADQFNYRVDERLQLRETLRFDARVQVETDDRHNCHVRLPDRIDMDRWVKRGEAFGDGAITLRRSRRKWIGARQVKAKNGAIRFLGQKRVHYDALGQKLAASVQSEIRLAGFRHFKNLFAYAKLAEDRIQQILGGCFADNFAHGLGGQAEIQSDQFEAEIGAQR